MGLIAGWFAGHGPETCHVRLVLTTGVLGGFTTFSAFSLDAMPLWERHEPLLGALSRLAG
jgi:CrcB protein